MFIGFLQVLCDDRHLQLKKRWSTVGAVVKVSQVEELFFQAHNADEETRR